MLYKIDLIIGLSTSSYGTTLIILQAMSFLRCLNFSTILMQLKRHKDAFESEKNE